MNNSTMNFTTFEAPTNSTTFYFGVMKIVDIFNLLLGLPTYSYILWLIITGTGSGVASDFFILNLSVCEIGNCVNSLFSIFEFHPIVKKLNHCILGLSITGRPLFQCLICVERYLAVVHPVTFLKYKPLRYRVICCSASWIITLGSSLFCVLIQGLFIVYTWFFLLQFLLFLSIQLFCCFTVLRALKQSGPGERKREQEEDNHMKRRAYDIILVTAVNMIVAYVPLIISGLFFILGQENVPQLFNVGYVCFILAGFVQSVLFLNRTGKLSCVRFV